MPELIVVGFKKDMYRASQVLNKLREMYDVWEVDLHDAVADYRDYNSKLRVDQSYQATTGEGPVGVRCGARLLARLSRSRSRLAQVRPLLQEL